MNAARLTILLGALALACTDETTAQGTPDAQLADTQTSDTAGLSDATGTADTDEPDTGEADTDELDTDEPDTGELDTGELDIGEPDTGELDTGELDTDEPDTGELDASDAADDVPDTTVDDDASETDAELQDTGPEDTGPEDTGPEDTGPEDTGPEDTGPEDTGPEDTGPEDTGPEDTGEDVPDTAEPDVGPPGCDWGPLGGPSAEAVADQTGLAPWVEQSGLSVCGPENKAWVKFVPETSGWHTFFVEEIQEGCVYTALHDGTTGVGIAGQPSEQAQAELEAGVPYYALIWGYGEDAVTGECGSAGEAGPFTVHFQPCAEDLYEVSGFTSPEVSTLGAAGLTGTICGNDDLDFYKVDITGNGELTVTVNHVSGIYHQTDLRLFDSPHDDPLSVVPVVSSEDTSGSGTNSITTTVTPGTWWLAVWGRGVETKYTLTLSGTAVN